MYGEMLNITLIIQGAFEYDFQVSSLKLAALNIWKMLGHLPCFPF
jgi:hypothetical protein